jgi:hypothetical protein
MLGNGHVRFGGGLRGKGPAFRRNLAAQSTLRPPPCRQVNLHPCDPALNIVGHDVDGGRACRELMARGADWRL